MTQSQSCFFPWYLTELLQHNTNEVEKNQDIKQMIIRKANQTTLYTIFFNAMDI
ncbi:hypothetical protein Syun_019497 [Stephania yunnanensis]|uniref:Uncharacterized protein n=1 Tax=Stephania yunnanensis TaxID=152371 RepID=A0AAP0IUZ2_9MAGN